MAKRNGMNKTKVSVGDIASTINEALKAFEAEVTDTLTEAADVAADAGLEVLETEGGYSDGPGEYRKNFTKVKRKNKRILRNRKAGLTHLLERGHATANGERTRAFPHWIIAEEEVIKVYQSEFKRRVK